MLILMTYLVTRRSVNENLTLVQQKDAKKVLQVVVAEDRLPQGLKSEK